MLAVYLLWHNFFWPRRIGAATRREGYMQGLRQTAVLYIGVFVLLSLAAVYEALVAIYLVPVLQPAG